MLRHILMAHKKPPHYIVENILVFDLARTQTLESVHWIYIVLDIHVLLYALAILSRAHCPSLWWTNLAPMKLLQTAYGKIQRPRNIFI